MSCPPNLNLNTYLSDPTNEYSADQLMDCVKGNDIVDNVIDEYFDHIENIFEKLDYFNKVQACWKRYQTINNPPSGWSSIDIDDVNNSCSTILPQNQRNKPNIAALTSYTNLNNAITSYETWLNTQTTISSGNTKSNKKIIEEQGANDTDFPISELNSKHKEIKDLRNSLETSLKELRLNSNSNAKDSKLELDANIYVSLLWTTLATGIVYYTFTAL